MNTLYLMLFFSFNLAIASMQQSYMTVDPIGNNIQQKNRLKESVARGKVIYLKKCARCHEKNGKGKLKVYPPLAQSDYLMGNPEESIKAIKYGLKKEIFVNGVRYKNRMPRIRLKNEQIVDVMNYISNAWNNKREEIITTEYVEHILKD
jgi:mono/diheme cytochrome c family protein